MQKNEISNQQDPSENKRICNLDQELLNPIENFNAPMNYYSARKDNIGEEPIQLRNTELFLPFTENIENSTIMTINASKA
jgi:hypothetical protein